MYVQYFSWQIAPVGRELHEGLVMLDLFIDRFQLLLEEQDRAVASGEDSDDSYQGNFTSLIASGHV